VPAVNLFSNQTGDATSSAGRVRQVLGNTGVEGIFVRAHGTWNLATVQMLVSDDNVTYQMLKDSRGDLLGFFNKDAAMLLTVPSGSYLKAVVSDSGSPGPSLTVRVSGDVSM